MEREQKGELRSWSELRKSLMNLIDECHRQHEKQEEEEKRKHRCTIKCSVIVNGGKKKRNKGIKIIGEGK